MSDQTQRAPDGAPVTTPAVLDSAHIGDIKGAFGTIGQHEHGRSGLRGRLLAMLAVLGPGIIVMVGDNDAGGVATYSQAGQDYGTSLLWVLVLLIPVLIVNQEMVIRLGAVTGVGHGKLIFERFGKFWGAFSVFDLFILNFLTIVTEFIGVDLALGYFGVSRYVSVPIAALLLDRGHRERELPPLGAVHVHVRVRQPAGDPTAVPEPPVGRLGGAPHRRCRALRAARTRPRSC